MTRACPGDWRLCGLVYCNQNGACLKASSKVIVGDDPVSRESLDRVYGNATPLTDDDLNEGLRLHRLTWDKPSQLADGFRAGARWAEKLLAERKKGLT